jgi:quercetin dioxygenase-like cupin family protein/rubrerythrin
MTTEPSYLPLLRRIANAECNAEVYLSAWAASTPREDVRRVISTVAIREGEHTKAFQKRVGELGYEVVIEEAPETAGRASIGAAADLTDREKFEQLGLGGRPDPAVPDRWVDYFGDASIDIPTGELLGRFISEERDSVRLLADCYAALCAEEDGGAGAGLEARLERIEAQLGRVLGVLDERSAPTTTEADFRAGLRADGFDDEIRITSYEPGASAGELHAHPFSARVLVLEGDFTLRYEDRSETLAAGRCCQLDAGTRHAEAAGARGARVLAGLKHPG